MIKRILYFMCATLVVYAEETTQLSSSEIRLESKSRQLSVELKDPSLSPEERAIRIEQWQREQEPLVEKIRLERAKRASSATIPAGSPLAENAFPWNEAVPSDPVLEDIHEIEKGVWDFQQSLLTQKLSPEQRAIQIEQFQLLNKETFRELSDLWSQTAAQTPAAEEPTIIEPTSEAPISAQTVHLKSEIDRVMYDLSQIDPETRAQYLETHAATLEAMGKELLKSLSPSTSTTTSPNTIAAP